MMEIPLRESAGDSQVGFFGGSGNYRIKCVTTARGTVTTVRRVNTTAQGTFTTVQQLNTTA